jgi:hypothetical protein
MSKCVVDHCFQTPETPPGIGDPDRGRIPIFSLKMAFFQNGVFIKRAKNGLPARLKRCAGMDFSLFLAFGNFPRHTLNIRIVYILYNIYYIVL